MRRSSRRSFGRRAAPSRVWQDLTTAFDVGYTATTATALRSYEAPTGIVQTADAPEDVTILRMIGDLEVQLDQGSSAWVLGLIIQDTTWTPNGSFADDADKPWMWLQTYGTGVNTGLVMQPPGYFTTTQSMTVVGGGLPREALRVDITPKRKLEAGKSLYLVGYEELGASTLTVRSRNMRLLYQRSRRR